MRTSPDNDLGLNHTLTGDPSSPNVLLLHGFMGSSQDWALVTGALEDCFHWIAPDLPGHGGSLRLPPDLYTIEGAARVLVRLFDELRIPRAVVAGYSMGGRLALYLALRYPERCAGLFLESASPGLESDEERKARRASDEERAARLASGDFDEFLEDWYSQPLFASLARDEALLRRTIESRRRNDPAELAKSLRGMGTGNQPSLWGELDSLQTPALTVAGELDDKYAGIARQMAAASPMISFAIVPGAGHNVHSEAPERYLEALQSFLVRTNCYRGNP